MNAGNRMTKCFALSAIFSLAVSSTIRAADYTWDASGGTPLNDGGGAWISSGGANWFNGSTYGAWGNTTADKAVIGVGNGAGGTIWQSGTNILNMLTFNAPGSGSYVLSQRAPGANVLSFGGTAPAIEVNSSALIDQNEWEADDNIAFDGDTLTVNIASGQTLTTRRMKGANASSTAFVTGGGTLRLLWDYWNNKFLNYSIASGSVLHLEGNRETPPGTNTISGSGTLRISGGRFACSGGGIVNLSLGSGGVIDIQSVSELYNGEWSNIRFLENRADMNVDGTLDLRDGNAVYVDALTGSGTITKAKQWHNVTLTVGVDNGSGTFSGTIVTNAAAESTVMNLVKTGSGTQTLSGVCQYAGATTVNNGVLQLAAGASLNPATVVSIDYPGKLNLDSSINQTVKQLMLDGVPKAAGTWGSTSSAAANKSDMYFQGTGVLTIQTGPKSYTWDADGVTPLNDGAGSWVASGGANWFNGSTYGAWGNTITNVAVIGANSGAAGTINQSGTVTLNGIVFDAPGSGNYTVDQSAVAGVNTLSFGGTGPAIIVNTSATIAQAAGGDDRMQLASGNLTINIAINQTLTTRKLALANESLSVIVTGGGTLSLLYEGYNKFMEGLWGNGAATLFVKGNSTIRLAEAFHCVSDYVRVDVAEGSTFDQNGKSEGVGYLSGAGTWINSGASTGGLGLSLPPYFTGANFSGVMSGGGGLVLAGGSGGNTQILSGTNSSYTGKTVIQKGTLQATSIKNAGVNSSLGAPTGANATIDLGNSADTGTLKYTGTGDTSDRVLNLAGTTGGGTIDQSGTGLLKFTSAMTASVSGAKTLTLQGSGRGELAGAIVDSASGATGMRKAGSGTWILSGSSTYTGATTVTPNIAYNGNAETLIFSNATGAAVQGNIVVDGASGLQGVAVLKMAATNQFGANSALTVADTTSPRQSVVKLMGHSQTIAGLEGGGAGGQAIVENTESETNAGATALLTINNSADYTYAGVLRDTFTGVGKVSVTKNGTGKQTFSGSGISYTGDTTINNGVLSLVSGTTLSTVSVLNINTPGKLEIAASNNQTVLELWIDGKPKARGTWGGSGSGASVEDPHFQGTGILTVTSGPYKGTVIRVL